MPVDDSATTTTSPPSCGSRPSFFAMSSPTNTGPCLLKIFSMVKVGVKPEVNALATIMVVLSLVLVLLSQLLLKEKKNDEHAA